MLDAIVGAVIAVTATTALLLAVQVTEVAFKESGRSPLLIDEMSMITQLGYNSSDGQSLEADLDRLPTQW